MEAPQRLGSPCQERRESVPGPCRGRRKQAAMLCDATLMQVGAEQPAMSGEGVP